MFYRLLYTTWRILWSSIWVLLLTVTLFCGVIFMLLQTSPVREYLAERTEIWFNKNFQGTLQIGELSGLLPLNIEVREVTLGLEGDTIAQFESLNVSVDLISLLRNHLSIHDIALNRPVVHLEIGESGRYTLADVFNKTSTDSPGSYIPEQAIQSFDIYAPFLRVNDASVNIVSWPAGSDAERLVGPLQINELHTEMFLEVSSELRYLDINYITFKLPELDSIELALSGQIYNDNQFLELNAMKLRLGESYFDWSSDFTDINLYAGDLSQQFRETSWLLIVEDAFVSPDEAGLLIPGLPEDFPGLEVVFNADGRGEMINMTDVLLSAGASTARLSAKLDQIATPERLTYDIMVDELRVDDAFFHTILPQSNQHQFQALSDFVTTGLITGTRDSLELQLEIAIPGGILGADGGIDLRYPYALEVEVNGTEMKLDEIEGFPYPGTLVNAEAKISGNRLAESDQLIQWSVDIVDTKIGSIFIPDFHLDAVLQDKIIRHEFIYIQGDRDQEERRMTGRGLVDLNGSIPRYTLRGNSTGLNLEEITDGVLLPGTDWNMNYDVNWNGRNLKEFHGLITLDVSPSMVNGRELKVHQFYLDLNRPQSNVRSLRLTSTLLDFIMEGQIQLTSVPVLYQYWKNYFTQRVEKEILFYADEELSLSEIIPDYDDRINVDMYLEMKDIAILSTYLPEIPEFTSSAQLAMQLNADQDSLGVNAKWGDSRTSWNGIAVDNSDISFAADFQYDQPLRDYSKLNLTGFISRMESHERNIEQLDFQILLNNGSFYNRNMISNFGNNVRLVAEMDGMLTDSIVNAEMHEFTLGNERYLWKTLGQPRLKYNHEGKWQIQALNLVSNSDQIYIDGIFSSSDEDSVEYRFENVDLDRISQMIGGRLQFEGLLNGNFVTKNLIERPVLQGNVSIERLAFNSRPVGDVILSSEYNTSRNRFDTHLSISTDSTRYSDYLKDNNGIGQDIRADGWIRAPGFEEHPDSLYYFDVNARKIDTWVLLYLLGNIFESIEGHASGTGYITGNYEYIDFNSDFVIGEARVRPVFFGTEYILDGEVSVGRKEGVDIHEVNIRDLRNGSGTLTGNYNFNDFLPEKNMDITLRMNNLRFLNNSDGPDVPFYGRVAGTGVVNISGTNVSPYIQTIEPIFTTSPSLFSIPLADQIDADDQGRFIRFVKDFNEANTVSRANEVTEVVPLQDRRFMEVFRLDLQFVAAPNSTVQLIFDPVTGEIVNARGSGRVRITLEDENLQIFGNYEISDGDYLFVGGDILTRRFMLREGGSIRWEGDPTNAILNITAAYRARPDIAPLLGLTGDQANRVPVELLLEITGPIDNLENNFYFEFPNAVDASQNATVLNILNSEDQKLIQATSLLFTGGFISAGLVGVAQTAAFQNTFQSRVGQVGISQLLSSQINSVLSDNLMNLDVDINLFGFDQADLGIALRLFDDRLVLRREGEVVGDETNIGDLGATYRINSNLSVEVFHRKDPMLMSILGAQAEVENVNGVGLEAQFRFNTWRDFGQTLWRNFTTFFGLWPGENNEVDDTEDEGDMDGPTELEVLMREGRNTNHDKELTVADE